MDILVVMFLDTDQFLCAYRTNDQKVNNYGDKTHFNMTLLIKLHLLRQNLKKKHSFVKLAFEAEQLSYSCLYSNRSQFFFGKFGVGLTITRA